jgi:hypothetical protein
MNTPDLSFLDQLGTSTAGAGINLAFLDHVGPQAQEPDENLRECETAGVPHGLKHVRQSAKRQFLNALQIDAAAEHIGELPRPGETLHCVVNARFKGFDVIPAILRLAAPAPIDELTIATLSFSRDNAIELLKLLDAGRVKACRFVCSSYFQKSDADIFNFMADGLKARGHDIRACRNHAKIVLAQVAGHWLTVEGSSNLRSCHTLEQFCMTNDRELYEFHRRWIHALFE